MPAQLFLCVRGNFRLEKKGAIIMRSRSSDALLDDEQDSSHSEEQRTGSEKSYYYKGRYTDHIVGLKDR